MPRRAVAQPLCLREPAARKERAVPMLRAALVEAVVQQEMEERG